MAEHAAASAADQTPVRYTTARVRVLARAGWFIATVVFAVALLLMLIAGSARLVINSPLLYEWDFSRYHIEQRTGLSRDELRSATRQIVDYFNGSDEFLDVRVSFGGSRVPLYREREILHMRDVKGLVRTVYATEWVALAYVLLFAGAGFAARRSGFWPLLKRGVGWSGIAAIGVVAFVGLGALINFDALFTQFHLISFTNNLWQLDPYRDYLLLMFPEGFFLDATLAIAALTIVAFGVIAGAVWFFGRRFAPRRAAGA